MFQHAIKKVRPYTIPVVAFSVTRKGDVRVHIGTFIVLNEHGDILTSSHIIENIVKKEEEAKVYAKYEDVKNNMQIDRIEKRKKLNLLSREIKQDTTQGIISLWGSQAWQIDDIRGNKIADIATGRIKGFNKDSMSSYPIFKNPSTDFDIGESLCKLGFPLYTVKATVDITKKSFEVPADLFPMPVFAIDGIYAREYVYQDEAGSILAKFIATSSPGLHGQSGGPIFDTQGRIWGLQSRTNYQEIVIKDENDPSGKKKIKSTFDYGLGTHAETIVNFLRENQIDIHISDD